MAKLVWDAAGERLYETGVDHGVIYPMTGITEQNPNGYGVGEAWNGLTAVTESPSGAEATPLYADNIKYLNLFSAEEFGGTIESYTYPDTFAECNGEAEMDDAPGVRASQQPRKKFGFTYRTLIGNDVDGNEHGSKIHIVYGAQASPSETANSTVNDSPEAITFSHEFTTTPIAVTGMKPTAHLEIDTTKISDEALKAIEDALYGVNADSTVEPAIEASDPTILTPDEVAKIVKDNPVDTTAATPVIVDDSSQTPAG